MESSGFSLGAELSFGMGWNEGVRVNRGEEKCRWPEGLGGQNRVKGQGVYERSGSTETH